MHMIKMKSQEIKRDNSDFWLRVSGTLQKNNIGKSDPDLDKLPEKKIQCL